MEQVCLQFEGESCPHDLFAILSSSKFKKILEIMSMHKFGKSAFTLCYFVVEGFNSDDVLEKIKLAMSECKVVVHSSLRSIKKIPTMPQMLFTEKKQVNTKNKEVPWYRR